jgi:hypothetical protein
MFKQKNLFYYTLVGALLCSQPLFATAQLNKSLSASNYKSFLAPQNGQPSTINLLKNDQPAYQIVIPDIPSTIDQKAASMLKSALDAGTGKNFKIVKASSYSGKAALSLGKTKLYKQSGLKPAINLQEDGYMLKVKGNNIFFIGGKMRGSISPVIAFIEEDLGGRLYSRQDEIQMPDLGKTQTIVSREYAPKITLRAMFQFESFDKEFQLFNRVGTGTSSYDRVPQAWGGSIKLPKQFFVHTFSALLPNNKYFDAHPEYFALKNGKRVPQGHGGGAQMCLTNPDVRRIVTARVLKELKTLHPYKLFDVSPNDTSGGFCQCKNCQAIAKREGSEAGPLLDFVNSIAREVKKKYPEVKITTLAYLESNKPPKNIRPDDNVIIRLASSNASFRYPMFFDEEIPEFYNNMMNWQKLGAKLFIWDYVVDYKAWPMPRPNLQVIDQNINLFAKNGVYGLFLQSSHYGVGENQGKLRAWVYAHKMWDPARRTVDLIRDFNYGYFGKVADLMQQYSDLLESEWNNFHDNHTYQDSKKYPMKFIFRDSFYPKARKIFNQALKLAATDPKLKAKVELEFISILFYRLEKIPPKGKADRESYIKDLDTFTKLTEKYKVIWISEKTTKTVQRIVEWKRTHNITSADDLPVILDLKPRNATRVGDGSKRLNDISAPGGMTIMIPMRGNAWAVQWFFGSALFNNVNYKVQIQIRADKKSDSGNAFGYGIYAVKAKKTPLKGIMDAAKISDSTYKWVDVGTVNGSDAASAYFYIAQISNSSISKLYIAAVKMIPQGVKMGKKATRKIVATPIVKYTTTGKAKLFPATTFRIEAPAKLTSDNGAKAVSILPKAKGWNTQLKMRGNVKPGKYHVRMLAKVTGASAGMGIRVAIYSPQAKKLLMQAMQPTTALPKSDQYQWIDLGTATTNNDPGAYLFISSYGDNSFKTLLVKSLEFTPVK